MAPTLLGAHARFTCDDCGYAFEANYSSPGGGSSDQNIPSEVDHVLFPTRSADELRRREPRPVDCPNCGHTVHDPDDPREHDDVPIHYGDRILVLKYAYLVQQPKRWDVVVFKSPDEPSPGSTWYTTNFIKRLVGRPDESVMIVDGDVYIREGKAEAEAAGDVSGFKIQGKPRHVQDALWRVVVDGAFVPRSGKWQPWRRRVRRRLGPRHARAAAARLHIQLGPGRRAPAAAAAPSCSTRTSSATASPGNPGRSATSWPTPRPRAAGTTSAT